MKIKEPENNKIEGAYSKLVNKMKDYLSITQLNIQNSNLFSENEKQKAQIKYLSENNNILKERNNNLEKMNEDLKLEIENKSNIISKDTKSHKNQIKLLMDQLSRIKETWTPYEKKMEYINHIEELEKNIKELKSDISRKKDIISSLKSQNEEKQQKIYKYDIESNNDTNSVISNNIININNKETQNLKNENLKKIKEIKELKKTIDKLNADKQLLMEKNKVNKVDINRKDDIINDLKSKITNLKIDKDKLNISKTDEQQKLLEELKKKEKSIISLKRNNDTLKKELQLYQNNNILENKNNNKLASNELLLKEKQIEEKENTINKMSTCLRLILKDLSKKYETEKNKLNLKNINNTVKEEMMKLGLDEENIGEFIGKDENINKTSEQIDILLNDISKFNSDKTFKLYNTLFDNIKELESENINNNGLSSNNFNRSANLSNNNFISSGNDNNLLGKYSGINNNFTRGNKSNMIESNY